MRLIVLPALALLSACDDSRAECDAAKDAAHQAWGELGVRLGMQVSTAKTAVQERESRLPAAQRAPPGALQVLEREIAERRAELQAAEERRAAADRVRETWRGTTAKHAWQASSETLAQFPDLAAEAAEAAGGTAFQVCAEVEK